jgi:hypothetical protein
MKHYDFFLFSQLWAVKNGKSEEPYDVMYEKIYNEFNKFIDSRFCVSHRGTYECIQNYLNRQEHQYLGLAAVTGHNPDVAFRYNALLEKIGAESMLMEVERWLDEPQSDSLVCFIESGFDEKGAPLPY